MQFTLTKLIELINQKKSTSSSTNTSLSSPFLQSVRLHRRTALASPSLVLTHHISNFTLFPLHRRTVLASRSSNLSSSATYTVIAHSHFKLEEVVITIDEKDDDVILNLVSFNAISPFSSTSPLPTISLNNLLVFMFIFGFCDWFLCVCLSFVFVDDEDDFFFMFDFLCLVCVVDV